MRNLVVLFNAQVSAKSMGGGDKIVLNISRRLKDKFNFPVVYAGCPEGKGMLENSYHDLAFIFLNRFSVGSLGFFIAYILRILSSPSILFTRIDECSLLWSASDFLPDTLPAFLFRFFHKNSRWISSLFLVARNPFRKEVVVNFRTVFYFLSQRISMILFKYKADGVCVLCDDDQEFLVKHGYPKAKVFLTSGGVDLHEFESVQEPFKKLYDACYIGRFHYQKGIDDLIYVWGKIREKIPGAKLVIVGWGDSESVTNLKSLIKEKKLYDNIELAGFLDGVQKISVIKSSKVLIFPSNFESWGVVVAEGIAAHVPVIAYSLKVLVNNFKKGVVWVDAFNKQQLYEKTLELIRSEELRNKLTQESRSFISTLDWQHTARTFVNNLSRLEVTDM